MSTRAAARTARAGALTGALLVSACATSTLDTQSENRGGLTCVDDSKHCVDQRMATLRTMMSDKDRRWIREPATPEAYASGVRLFAFKGRKKDLTCEELAIGKREADTGPGVLRGPAAAGLSPAQVSRGTMLAGEVSKELSVEMRRRCKV